ncbi:MAG: hypothetical protein ACI4TP_05080 [Anaerotignum sp.]
MLVYIILMVGIAVFFYKESKKLLVGQSNLLKEFCNDPVSQKIALSTLRILCLTSAASALLMLLAFLLSKLTGTLPTAIAALSILCYTGGFIFSMLKLKKL